MQSAYFSLLLLLSGCITHHMYAGHFLSNNPFNLLASLQENVQDLLAESDDEESFYSSDDDSDDMAIDFNIASPSRFAYKIDTFLKNGGDPNFVDQGGRTLCHLAVELDDVDALELLIAHKAEVNAPHPQGITPAHLAAYFNNVASLTLLITHKAKLDAVDINGFTPAHSAAQNNSIGALKLLAAHGAPVDTGDIKKSTPLHWAAGMGHVAATDVLLTNGAGHCVNCIDALGKTPLHRAAGVSSKVVKLLFDSGFIRRHTINKIDHEGSTPLLYAASGGRRKAMELLIANGASVNQRNKANGRTPLLWVQRMTKGSYEKGGRMMSRKKGLNMIKTLLDHGANPTINDYEGYSPLYWALHTQRAEEIALLQSYIHN